MNPPAPGRRALLRALLCLAAATVLCPLAGSAPVATVPVLKAGDKIVLYVGTYARPDTDGIRLFEIEPQSGALTAVAGFSGVTNPSFLALHPGHRFLYAVSEVGDYEGKKAGAVSAYQIDPSTHHLTFLNRQSTGGDSPCFVTVDRTGQNVLVANYGGGSIAVLPIGKDGRLAPATAFVQHKGSGPVASRQEAPHAHSINVDPANRYALAADLGLDRIMVYRFDADRGTLKPNSVPFAAVVPGSGPRHLAFAPDGRHAYVINEMKSTLTAFKYDPKLGSLKEIQTISALPEDYHGSSTGAEVVVHPSGKFLYGSNRGHDSLAIYSIDSASGKLTLTGHASTGGKTPRGFAVDPSGRYLVAANQDSNNIVVFRIDPETGALAPTGQTAEVPKPVAVRMMIEPAPAH